MSKQQLTGEEQARHEAKKRADDLRGLITHFGSFLAVGLFFFLINLASDPGNWWFFYPMLVWGVGMFIHGWNVLGSDRLFGHDWAERKAQSILEKDRRSGPGSAAVEPTMTEDAGDIVHQSAVLIDRMRRAARQIPKPDIRRQTLAICASADQVLSAIEENPQEITIARDFLNRYLAPATTIISDYARLASRNVASAQPTLAKVESHDLPLLSTKLDDLYDRLHRGKLIDLEVAREMLSFDVADWDDNGNQVDKLLNTRLSDPAKQDV